MSYTIAWDNRGVVWTFYGVLTCDDVVQANLDIYGDSRFDELRYQVVDISDVERFDVSADAMEVAASMDEVASLSNPHLVVAVVATGEEGVAVAEMYLADMKDTSWEVRIFPSMADAGAWIQSTVE